MQIGKYYFDLDNEPVIMGILNVTPDSFSDGGKFNSIDRALKHTEEMIRDGAKIIDVGGESTRPGYTKISDEEEIERTVPIIEAIKNNFDVAVSLDTYKGNVAKAGVKAGIDMINDIWGFKYDEEVAKSIAGTDVAACVMHKGPYSTLGEASSAVYKWIEENNYIPCDNPRESYIDGIWNKEDPEEWLTEIQVPIVSKNNL